MNPQIRAANDAYASVRPPQFDTSRPARHLVIVTCMDARLDLLGALGLEIGDAHFLRNGGGRVTPDVIRSLALSTHALGTTEVGVIHHTDCGMSGTTNEELRALVGTTPERARAVADVDFLPFDDAAASVRVDLVALRDSGVLPDDTVTWGAVYDVDTGRVTEVTLE